MWNLPLVLFLEGYAIWIFKFLVVVLNHFVCRDSKINTNYACAPYLCWYASLVVFEVFGILLKLSDFIDHMISKNHLSQRLVGSGIECYIEQMAGWGARLLCWDEILLSLMGSVSSCSLISFYFFVIWIFCVVSGLVSDAFHLTFGCGLLSFSLFAMAASRQKPDRVYTYG